jgi:hypothetical protein
MCVRRPILKAILLASVLAFTSVPAWAGFVYVQQPNLKEAYPSQSGFAVAYDNFTLGATTEITRAEWIGSYFTNKMQITGWTVTFWADAAGHPGDAIKTFNIPGDGGESLIGIDNTGNVIFIYAVNLNFAAAGNTEYWLSAVPDLAHPSLWGWQTSSQGDGLAYDELLGSRTALNTDFSFAFFGTPVPEAGTLFLAGAGVLCLAEALRRKVVKEGANHRL